MNIKYVSLLSLFCIAGAQALTIVERAENAVRAYDNCMYRRAEQSTSWSRLIEDCISCDEEHKEYENALIELDSLFWDKVREGQDTKQCMKSLYKNMPCCSNKKRQTKKIIAGYIAEKITDEECVVRYNRVHDSSLEEYLEKEIDSAAKKITPKVKNELSILHGQEYVDQVKAELKQMVSDTPSKIEKE